METFFGFDEESVDSETLSETSCNTDRTDRAPATPEEDLDDVSGPHPRVLVKGCLSPHPASVAAGQTSQDLCGHSLCPGRGVPTFTGSENGDGGAPAA